MDIKAAGELIAHLEKAIESATHLLEAVRDFTRHAPPAPDSHGRDHEHEPRERPGFPSAGFPPPGDFPGGFPPR
jgi:hypothetical protein